MKASIQQPINVCPSRSYRPQSSGEAVCHNESCAYSPSSVQPAMLTDAERHRVLVEWNDTTQDYPLNQCIHQLFEAQVKLTPETVAVVFEAQQLSYQELNRRANQLAGHLQSLGVGPEVLVGLCVERSLDRVITISGV